MPAMTLTFCKKDISMLCPSSITIWKWLHRSAWLSTRSNPIAWLLNCLKRCKLQMLHAASRLPDISIVITYQSRSTPLYFMCEPCDPLFEGLRSASEANVDAYCIDLDVDYYPDIREPFPILMPFSV